MGGYINNFEKSILFSAERGGLDLVNQLVSVVVCTAGGNIVASALSLRAQLASTREKTDAERERRQASARIGEVRNTQKMTALIEGLRENVRKLKPDGDDGFEGLMAAVLTDLTRRSFAIASSGSQRGRDGQSALDRGVVLFEAKRYDDTLPKEKILTKITEIAGDTESTPELFIVGATGPIWAQHISLMQSAARRFGMVVMALSWPETGLPDLAVFLAMAPDVSAEFIARHISVSQSELLLQLNAVQSAQVFGS
ncbi:hypothetical protein NDK50_22435 [Paraburkholderia bryophila]|uniref:hypothetical protein n=1 Tax=Paraburkholderia bryophila TaxID=420952 RepID=UPI00234AE488|nr:hypothetical protein [Paraburkholderia bryophila]WCM23623.1 hypothetical protein NDK50_22435 [Paraburkholderia bryophila]